MNEIPDLDSKIRAATQIDFLEKRYWEMIKELHAKNDMLRQQVKDLEDIEINITWNENSMRNFGKDELNFARALLRKASEK